MIAIIITLIICLTILACVEIIVNGTEFFRCSEEKDQEKKEQEINRGTNGCTKKSNRK